MSAGPVPGEIPEGARAEKRPGARSSKRLGRMLQGGILLGSGFLVLGAILGASRDEMHRGLGVEPPVLLELARDLARFDTAALLRAGLLVLILTPVVRVVAAAWLLGRAGDRLAVACAIAVLALLVAASFLGSGHL